MKNTKYLVFLDVDGTLVESGRNDMSPNIVKQMQRLKPLGHKFIIVTGRALKGVRNLQGYEHFNYIAALFGSVVFNNETQSLEKQPQVMPTPLVKAFIREIENLGLEWTYKDYLEQKTAFTSPKLAQKYILRYIDKQELQDDLNKNAICQLLVDGAIPQNIIDKYSDEFDFYKMPTDYYDITLKGASKDKIVNYFKAKFPGYTAVAIGDAANDIDMFRAADMSISMGNSNDDIKALTTFVTKSVADDGVAYALTDILKL